MTGLSGLSVLEAAQPAVRTAGRRRGVRGTVRPRTWGVLWALAAAGALVGVLWTGRPLLNPAGLPLLGRFWAAAVHPDLSVGYLLATADATLTTLAFAVLGTGLSVVLGAALAPLLSELWWAPGSGRPAARTRSLIGLLLARGAVAVPRGVHEVVWGLLLLSVLGRDPLVGVLAIALPFGAITAKVFAEILDEADRGPYAVLREAGAGRTVALVYGLLPTVSPRVVSYAFYRFECSLRSAVVLGLVGAGGLGFQLALSFQGLRYDQLWTSLYVLILLCALVDRWSATLRRDDTRRRSPWRSTALLGLLLAAVSVWHLGPEVSRWFSARTLRLLARLADDLTPLQLPTGGWPALLRGAFQTLQLSVLAITLAALAAVMVAFVAARGPATPLRSACAAASRVLLLATRAVPPPVWALLVLFVVFPGPLPGALALAVYTFGVLGRLFAEVVEGLDPRPRQALDQLGAGPLAAFAYGAVPAAAGPFASLALYRWEVTLRETVVVGVVGAGGPGRLLEQQRAAFAYPALATTVLTLVVLSLLVDGLSLAIGAPSAPPPPELLPQVS